MDPAEAKRQARRRKEQVALFALRLVAFVLVLWLLWTRTGEVAGVASIAALLVALAIGYGATSLIQSRRWRANWEALLATGALRPEGDPPSDSAHQPRLAHLPPLIGTVGGRPVTVVADRVPIWLSGSFGSHASETHLTTPLPESHREIELRLEPRKRGERTDTRIDSAQTLGERTPFEKAHHLFTPQPGLARTLFDQDLQEAIDRIGRYRTLRVRQGTVRLSFDGAAEPAQVRQGLDLVADVAKRLATLPPPAAAMEATAAPTRGATGATG